VKLPEPKNVKFLAKMKTIETVCVSEPLLSKGQEYEIKTPNWILNSVQAHCIIKTNAISGKEKRRAVPETITDSRDDLPKDDPSGVSHQPPAPKPTEDSWRCPTGANS